MSEAAWKILTLFLENGWYDEKAKRRYFASWHFSKALDCKIDAANVKHNPRNEYEQALHDLIDLGLVEEMPNLGERFHLIVK